MRERGHAARPVLSSLMPQSCGRGFGVGTRWMWCRAESHLGKELAHWKARKDLIFSIQYYSIVFMVRARISGWGVVHQCLDQWI